MPRLHLVTNDEILSRSDWLSSAAEAMEVGGSSLALHVRGPRTCGATLFDLTTKLWQVAVRTGTRLMVNDRVDVAKVTRAHGVHLGKRSLTVRQARSLLGPARTVGVSAHASEEIRIARREGADFAFGGTVYPTPSHEGVSGMGLSRLREAVRAAEGLPVLGIGGIGLERVAAVLGTGAHGVAVIRGVWDRTDPGAAVREYVQAIEETIDG